MSAAEESNMGIKRRMIKGDSLLGANAIGNQGFECMDDNKSFKPTV